VRIWGLSKTQAHYRPAPTPRGELQTLQVHVSSARAGRVPVRTGTDPRHRNMRPIHSSTP
jgi:hypothetical protein